ncbi:MAG: hypothetical protein ACPLX8_01420 [Nanopusillaceae archaeon]
MKKEKVIDLLIFLGIVILIIYIIAKNIFFNYKNYSEKIYYYNSSSGVLVSSPYSIEELSYIPIVSNVSLNKVLENYSFGLLIFDPHLSGYYNAEVLYILLKIPNLNPTCLYYVDNCKYFLQNNSIFGNNLFLYSPGNYSNITYILPLNQTLLIYIIPSNDSIEIVFNNKNNTIFIIGPNNESAEQLAAKFVLYWYGIINN